MGHYRSIISFSFSHKNFLDKIWCSCPLYYFLWCVYHVFISLSFLLILVSNLRNYGFWKEVMVSNENTCMLSLKLTYILPNWDLNYICEDWEEIEVQQGEMKPHKWNMARTTSVRKCVYVKEWQRSFQTTIKKNKN